MYSFELEDKLSKLHNQLHDIEQIIRSPFGICGKCDSVDIVRHDQFYVGEQDRATIRFHAASEPFYRYEIRDIDFSVFLEEEEIDKISYGTLRIKPKWTSNYASWNDTTLKLVEKALEFHLTMISL